jgi:hypothetical protein
MGTTAGDAKEACPVASCTKTNLTIDWSDDGCWMPIASAAQTENGKNGNIRANKYSVLEYFIIMVNEYLNL